MKNWRSSGIKLEHNCFLGDNTGLDVKVQVLHVKIQVPDMKVLIPGCGKSGLDILPRDLERFLWKMNAHGRLYWQNCRMSEVIICWWTPSLKWYMYGLVCREQIKTIRKQEDKYSRRKHLKTNWGLYKWIRRLPKNSSTENTKDLSDLIREPFTRKKRK